MAIEFDDPVKQEVWNTLLALNKCWTQGDGAGLRDFFHEQMIAITPVARERSEGREACVAGWAAFAQAARTRYFRESDPIIQVRGDMAMAAYYYDMEYELAGKLIRTAGRDLFVFVRENGRWWAIADHFSPNPGESF